MFGSFRAPEVDAARVRKAHVRLEDQGDLQVSGPYRLEHFELFFIEKPAAPDFEVVTLEEALQNGTATVRELDQPRVEAVVVENRGSLPLFIHAGDVIRGGRQDRAAVADVIIPPAAGSAEVRVFCVERGRWEGGQKFHASDYTVTSKELRLSIRLKKDQGEVWDSVVTSKDSIRMSLKNLRAARSTSLAEELTSEEVRSRVRRWERALVPILQRHPGASGLAFAVSGRINTIDVYHSPAIFRKMFRKLVRSYAVEALSQRPGEAFGPVPPEQVCEAMLNARLGKAAEEPVDEHNKVVLVDGAESVLFHSFYGKQPVHLQVIRK